MTLKGDGGQEPSDDHSGHCAYDWRERRCTVRARDVYLASETRERSDCRSEIGGMIGARGSGWQEEEIWKDWSEGLGTPWEPREDWSGRFATTATSPGRTGHMTHIPAPDSAIHPDSDDAPPPALKALWRSTAPYQTSNARSLARVKGFIKLTRSRSTGFLYPPPPCTKIRM